MHFPSAKKGVKKLYLAQLFELICGILTAVAVVASLVTMGFEQAQNLPADAVSVGTAVAGVAAIAGVIAMVLALAAFVLEIVGVVQGMKEEDSFKTALIFLLVGIVASTIASSFSESNEMIADLCKAVNSVCSLLVTVYVATAIRKIAEQLNKPKLAARATRTIRIVNFTYIFTIAAQIIVSFINNEESPIAMVLALAAAILNIVSYFVNLKLLNKAKNAINA